MNRAPFPDPESLRRAMTDRLRTLAAKEPGNQLTDLLRQFAYDRLLCRVFAAPDRDRWILKGATALLARLGPAARHTVDIDLLATASSLDEAEEALRRSASTDLGDFFRFTLSPGRPVAQGGIARRVSVVGFLGATRFAEFHVDLVVDLAMTGAPDEVGSLVPLELPGIPRVTYRAYPLQDHIADKVCALLEVHVHASGTAQVSSRYRDLADLAVLARTVSVGAAELGTAIRSETARRGLALPRHITAPGDARWPAGYARVARRIARLSDKTVDAATETVGCFIDPVLAGLDTGRWNPESRTWL